MRLLCELFIIAGLIYVGWEKPFQEWLPGSTPRTATVAPSEPGTTQPAWMRDPNHRTALDTPRPAYSHVSGTPSGSWLFDPNHHSPLDPPAHASASPH
jgi:hypothetical protein